MPIIDFSYFFFFLMPMLMLGFADAAITLI